MYSPEELDEMVVGIRLRDWAGNEGEKKEDGLWHFIPGGVGLTALECNDLFPKPGPSILTEAQDTISTSRQADYGDAQVSFKRIADLWSTYLGQEVSAQDVACLMALMKISRIKGDPSKRDSWVDLAGYAGLGGELG